MRMRADLLLDVVLAHWGGYFGMRRRRPEYKYPQVCLSTLLLATPFLHRRFKVSHICRGASQTVNVNTCRVAACCRGHRRWLPSNYPRRVT
jgi:hypothetical protein